MTGGRATTMVVAVMLGLCVQGCGYRLSAEGLGPLIGGGPAMMGDEGPVVRLAIRTFRNRTFHNNLEYAYTRFMRQEFAVRSGARVVADDAQADYVMTGEIVSAAVLSLTFSTDATREQRVDVAVSATVTNRRTGDAAWTGTATGAGEFFVNRAPDADNRQDEIQFNQVLQERALEQAGQDAAATLAASFRDARRQGNFSPGPSSPATSSQAPASTSTSTSFPRPSSSTRLPLLEHVPGSIR